MLAAINAPGSTDVLVLVSSASESRWQSGGDRTALAVARTFKLEATEPTKLEPELRSDYRAKNGVFGGNNPLSDITQGFSTEPSFGSAGGVGGALSKS